MADGFHFNFFGASESDQSPGAGPSNNHDAYEVLASKGLKVLWQKLPIYLNIQHKCSRSKQNPF
jgi:hypothetical protein